MARVSRVQRCDETPMLRHQVEMFEKRTTELRDTGRWRVDELQDSLALLDQMSELAAKRTDGPTTDSPALLIEFGGKQ